ncbi:AAA family ATPase [Vibrio parahaemolyticus]|nr:AAA family ATPase [Vibrio parahaemolyticus]HCM0798618.1 AAA family ATPase [Vibrio parahaemolyticus]
MELHQIEPVIEFFKIYGLHKERDITLDMNGNVKILVGDNGSGKTTLLNCMYYVLNKQFEKLNNVCFDKIEIKFFNAPPLFIKKSDIEKLDFEEVFLEPQLRDLRRYVPRELLYELIKRSGKSSFSSFSNYIRSRSIAYKIPMSVREIYEACRMGYSYYNSTVTLNSANQKWNEYIDNHFKLKVLYLPTYRRVEEDLTNLGNYDYDFSDSLINFGMSDVKQRFRNVRNELRDSAVSLYTNLNGKMLTQLTTDYVATEEQFQKIKNTEALKIVLDRVGDSISSDTKNRILQLVEKSTIEQERYHPLVFILSNLIDVYFEQKELDDAIKEFVSVSNKYLVNKTFVYNESKVEITIINNRSDSEVDLDNLSSGEKQLVSIFSKLYLERQNNYAVLFDEPELSLSIEWQTELLPDILKSSKCGYMLAATHSPFIFQNSLDSLTDSLHVTFPEG